MSPFFYPVLVCTLAGVALLVSHLAAQPFWNTLIVMAGGALVVGFASYTPSQQEDRAWPARAIQPALALLFRLLIGIAVIALMIWGLLAGLSRLAS